MPIGPGHAPLNIFSITDFFMILLHHKFMIF